jgi:hypothetical protein
VLLSAVIVWALLGILVGYLADLTVAESVACWYLPAAAALLLGIDGYRIQREVAAERERIIPSSRRRSTAPVWRRRRTDCGPSAPPPWSRSEKPQVSDLRLWWS